MQQGKEKLGKTGLLERSNCSMSNVERDNVQLVAWEALRAAGTPFVRLLRAANDAQLVKAYGVGFRELNAEAI